MQIYVTYFWHVVKAQYLGLPIVSYGKRESAISPYDDFATYGKRDGMSKAAYLAKLRSRMLNRYNIYVITYVFILESIQI